MKLRVLSGMLVSLLIVLSVAAAPAAHAEPIKSQWYVGPTGLEELKKQGLDGSGVTIGVIDLAADPSAPELAGVDLTVKDDCKEPQSAVQTHHANAVISILANQVWGWAPKAKIINYVYPDKKKEDLNAACQKREAYNLAYLLHKAISDGVDIVSITVVGQGGLGYVVARANQHGIPIVVGAGNTGVSAIATTGSSIGIVAVGASDKAGERAIFSTHGPGLTVLAPGVDIKIRSNGILTREGTSYATPMVVGALSLAKQKWPNATGNQLIQSLIKTSSGAGSWQPNSGWGVLDARKLVAADPTGYVDDNPLMLKNPEDYPGVQQVEDYLDGLVEFRAVRFDPEYIYRGDSQLECDEKPERCQLNTSPRFAPSPTPTPTPTAATPTPAPSKSGESSSALVIGVVVAVVVAAAGVGVVLVRKRGRQ